MGCRSFKMIDSVVYQEKAVYLLSVKTEMYITIFLGWFQYTVVLWEQND